MANVSQGFINLITSEATDLSVINAARVSFGKRQDKVDISGEKLINFLMRERHGTPFEHNFFNFHVKCPIFVAREWFRHRIGSFNEISGRYSIITDPEYFVPDVGDVRTQVGKPGNYTFEPHPFLNVADSWLRLVKEHNQRATDLYEAALEMGIAKEQARIVFPVALYTEFYWSVNARALMNFLSLRNSIYAMKEIRDFAKECEILFQQEMPVTHNAFVNNGRQAV